MSNETISSLIIKIASDKNQLDAHESYWYDFLIQIQALPKIRQSAFDETVLNDWYKHCINPVTPSDSHALQRLINDANETYLQSKSILTVDFNKLFIGNVHTFGLDNDFLNSHTKNSDTSVNNCNDCNEVFAIILQLMLNYKPDDVDFINSQAFRNVFELINRLPLSLSFYLFRLMVQTVYHQENGLFELVSSIAYLHRNGYDLPPFYTMKTFYAELLTLQFNAAKNGVAA